MLKTLGLVAKKTSGRRFSIALLLGMSAVAMPPSARVMAASRRNANGDAGEEPAQHSTVIPASASSHNIPILDYDRQAERQLLDLANQARSKAGLIRLTLDVGISQAARAHAEAMFAARELSHQFVDEPTVAQRLAAASHTQLEQAAENIALDFDAAQAQQHLMHSPPHRANLLNPAYNVIGLGVIRSGDRLYIVEDFGHALPSYSTAEVRSLVAVAVAQARREASQPDLIRRDLPKADDAACSMAQEDKLGTSPVHQLAQRHTVLTYTSLHPEALPSNASRVLVSPNLSAFSVGACYAHTATYPSGVYWVVVSLD
ncbi:MAG: CAP domain-containing protein [Candidatus Sulfotelmatobacter sp.]